MSQAAGTNPYETPTSSLLELQRMLERRRVLKLYLGLAFAGIAARVLLTTQGPPRVLDLGGVVVLGLALPALFGYAYRLRIGRAWLWKVWLPVAVAGALSLQLAFPIPLAPRLELAARAYVYLFDALLCAALYLYAFRSPEIWRTGSS